MSPDDRQECKQYESTNRVCADTNRPGTSNSEAAAPSPLQPGEYRSHDLAGPLHHLLSNTLLLVDRLLDERRGRFVRHLRVLVRPQLQSLEQPAATVHLRGRCLPPLAAQ